LKEATMATKPTLASSAEAPAVGEDGGRTVRLFQRKRSFDAPEAAIGLPPSTVEPAAASILVPTQPVPDLTGQPKVWFVSGPGRSGKTTFLRYVLETVAASEGEVMAAALDPQNRSLAAFIEGVDQPPTNEAGSVAAWLEEYLRFSMEEQRSAVLDLGGGDTSLSRLLDDAPDLADVMQESGVAPVAIYTLGPRIDDLSSLASFENKNFAPKATALILNEGLVSPTQPREEAFGWVLNHSAFRAAVQRGAVPIWMPRLDANVASEIEAKRVQFSQARDGQEPHGRDPVGPLGPLNRSRVRKWMNSMDQALAPIRSWFP
jgi:hypothetical protein